MPVDDVIPTFLDELENKKSEFGISSYTFTVEQIEDVILKLIMNEEAARESPE